MTFRQIRRVGAQALIVGSLALAQEQKPDTCAFLKVQKSTFPLTVWQEVKEAFSNLTQRIQSLTTNQKNQLNNVHQNLIKLVIEKNRYVGMLDKYLKNDKVTWADIQQATEYLIHRVAETQGELQSAGNADFGVFGAEPKYKQLMQTLDVKRMDSLCSISSISPSDTARLKELKEDLDKEIKVIDDADDTLAEIIKPAEKPKKP